MPRPLQEFSYGDVELEPRRAQTQLEQTQSVLMALNEASFLKTWRLRAGLPAPGPDLGEWYDELPLQKPKAAATASRRRTVSANGFALYAPAISGPFSTPQLASSSFPQLFRSRKTSSHSRPHVSDGNPYSESQFRTLKYRPGLPDRFGSSEDARGFG